MEELYEIIANLPLWSWIVIGIIIILSTIGIIASKSFKMLVLKLVLHAEETIIGEKKGPERYQFVAERIYAVLPKILQILFPPSYIKSIIEEAVIKMKKMLEDENKSI